MTDLKSVYLIKPARIGGSQSSLHFSVGQQMSSHVVEELVSLPMGVMIAFKDDTTETTIIPYANITNFTPSETQNGQKKKKAS